jgi:hypothetical protein
MINREVAPREKVTLAFEHYPLFELRFSCADGIKAGVGMPTLQRVRQ